ncbi:MAG: NAD(P)/FAD-dependent oxidoreductase [Clostridia bacterium]|nr:NAD(P)/FAD-dependent oxidoreductase [Clostridia bacterium]
MLDVAVIGCTLEGLLVADRLLSAGFRVAVFPGYEEPLSISKLIKIEKSEYDKPSDLVLFMEKLYDKARGHDNFVFYSGKIMSIVPFNDSFMVSVDDNIYEAKSILLANNYDNVAKIPGEDQYFLRGISYNAIGQGGLYMDKEVAVYAQSKKAAAEINYLNDIGVRTLVISPNQLFGLARGINRRIIGEISLVSGDRRLRYLVVNGKKIDATVLFIIRDCIFPKSLFRDIKLDSDGYIIVDNNFQTNIDGVYATGNCISKVGDIKKAISRAVVVGRSMNSYLNQACNLV